VRPACGPVPADPPAVRPGPGPVIRLSRRAWRGGQAEAAASGVRRSTSRGRPSDPGRYPPLTAQQRDFLAASGRAQTRQARRRRRSRGHAGRAPDRLGGERRGRGPGRARRARRGPEREPPGQPRALGRARCGKRATGRGRPRYRSPAGRGFLADRPDPAGSVEHARCPGPARARSLRCYQRQAPRHRHGVRPSGQVLIAGGDDGLVRLWDVATRRELGSPFAVVPDPGYHNGAVNGVQEMALSPLGSILATAGRDGVVRLWNLASRREIGPPIGVGAGGFASALAFSPQFSLVVRTPAGRCVRGRTATRTATGGSMPPRSRCRRRCLSRWRQRVASKTLKLDNCIACIRANVA
jgi:hypothetical protein